MGGASHALGEFLDCGEGGLERRGLGCRGDLLRGLEIDVDPVPLGLEGGGGLGELWSPLSGWV